MKSLELARIALITLIVITLLGIVQTVAFGDETGANSERQNCAAANDFSQDL